MFSLSISSLFLLLFVPAKGEENIAPSTGPLQANPFSSLHNLLLPLQHATLFNSTFDIGQLAISTPCMMDLVRLLEDLRARKPLALQMVDSFGKIPSGLIRGHLQWLGSYDECLSIPNKTVNYCLMRLGTSDDLTVIQKSPALGVCLPRSCGTNDIEGIINKLIELLITNAPVPIPELENLRARATVCDTDSPWNFGGYAIIVILALFAVICTFGTVVECYSPVRRFIRLRRSTLITVNGSDDLEVESLLHEGVVVGTMEKGEPTTMVRCFECFSFAGSWRFFTDDHKGDLRYLDGVRVATIWWVILGEEFQIGEFAYANAYDYMDGMKTFLGQLIANANLAADTFFIVSGLVLTLTILTKLDKLEGKINWPWLYIRRILRLTPMYGIMLVIFGYLVPHIVNGPFLLLVGQDLGGNPLDTCKANWWTNMLYINNFVPADTRQLCMDWTWFLAVQMQFFLITPPIVFLLYKWPKIGLSVVVALIAGCLITNAVIEASVGLPIAMFQEPLIYNSSYNTTYNPNYNYAFDKPYTRASPYLMGMLLGFLFVRRPVWKFPFRKLDLVFNLGCWICSCIVANRVIFGLWDAAYISPTSVDMVGRVSWAMLSRFGFSLAVSWVIFACQYGYAGPVRDILEWKVFRPLSRLTYIVYLFHPLTLQLWFITQRDPFFYNPINMCSIFFAQLVCIYGLSFIFGVLIEFPLLRLERTVLR